nr:type II toxin-antitoxin system prevent-host-death family antitoxin [Mesorhizobium sp.]
MDETVLATDVERKFSSILRGVREGKSYVVISHGRPVARIVPADRREGVFRRSRDSPLSMLETGSVTTPTTKGEGRVATK